MASSIVGFSVDNFRYIMDDPICPDIETCKTKNPECKGRRYTNKKGKLRLQSRTKQYASNFHCRWEIVAPEDKKIRLRITQGKSKFGIEHHKSCGFDRLHIQSGVPEDKGNHRFGRLCSTKVDDGKTYNGISAHMSQNRVKIESYKWQDWITLPTNHLVIAFDTDRIDTKNRGFRLVYEFTDEYTVPNEVREEIKNLKQEEQVLMKEIFTPSDKYYKRIAKKIRDHFDQIFEKWHSCGGASMDPNYVKPKPWDRNTFQLDRTNDIKAIYERYRSFITRQLVDLGSCPQKHINKINSKKANLERIFIRSCKRVQKCF